MPTLPRELPKLAARFGEVLLPGSPDGCFPATATLDRSAGDGGVMSKLAPHPLADLFPMMEGTALANKLTMCGRNKYSTPLGAAIGYLIQWQEHDHVDKDSQPTHTAILQLAETFKGIEGSVEIAARGTRIIRSHSVLAMCHWIFSRKSSRAAADEFINKVIDGNDLKKGDPILYCRNRLMGMTRANSVGERIELVFKCWNAWRRGERIESYLKLSGAKLPKVSR
jgi:hypothetical protein